jgi:hypothetical protein
MDEEAMKKRTSGPDYHCAVEAQIPKVVAPAQEKGAISTIFQGEGEHSAASLGNAISLDNVMIMHQCLQTLLEGA